MVYIFLLLNFFGISFSLTLENMVFSNSYGQPIDFTFYNNEAMALESANNSIWIETTDFGYAIMYDAYENIAGFQFNLFGLANYDKYKFVNGQMQKYQFTLSQTEDLILGFSFDGKVLETGIHTLLEIRHLDNKKEDVAVENNFYNTNRNNRLNIDMTNIVVSGPDGTPANINLTCHKDKCKDFRYDYDKGERFFGLVNFNLKTEDFIIWEVYYNSDINIAGYQFDIEGAKVVLANGGDTQSSGFTVSNGSNTILAFSFKGDVIPAGSGKLLEFKVE